MTHDTLTHLQAHHGDFATFRDLMRETAVGRFGPIWWGVWDQYIAPTLPAIGTVVDLGCGPGGLFPSLRMRHRDVRIIGVEVQPAMLAAARDLANELQATIVEADLASVLPLPDACADAVTAVHVLHELPWPMPLLRETVRILKPGAKLLLYDWCRQPLRDYVGEAELDDNRLQHFREHCLYTPDDLQFLCEQAGLQTLEVIGRRNGAYAMLVLLKPA